MAIHTIHITNKNKADLPLSPELQRILAQGQAVRKRIQENLAVAYFVLDGHFGNAFATASLQDAAQRRTLSASHGRGEKGIAGRLDKPYLYFRSSTRFGKGLS